MHLLLAEDDPALTVLLCDRFRRAGHEVTHAADGEAAWAALTGRADAFDLAVLDIMITNLDGWALCRRIKGGQATRGVPVIIVSAKSTEADKRASYDAGADLYLPKPFDFTELLAGAERLARTR